MEPAFTVIVTSSKHEIVPSVIVALYVVVEVGLTLKIKGEVVDVVSTWFVDKLVNVIVEANVVEIKILSRPQLSVDALVAIAWCHLNRVLAVIAPAGIGYTIRDHWCT